MVEDSGENSILVVPGANGCVTTVDVQQAEQAFRQCDCVILQWEIPAPAIAAAIDMAKRFGKRIIMNPAPFQDGFRSLIPGVDLIIPNQTETAGILGVHVESSAAALEALPKLLGLGASNAIITLGGSGAVVSDGLRSAWLQPLKVEAVDTTAAGDAFVGALAVAWARHACLFTAARYAIAASALAVTRHGAQPSLPRQDEVEALMARIPEPEFAN